MMTTIFETLLTPTAPFWKGFILVMAGVIIGATIADGWRQWFE